MNVSINISNLHSKLLIRIISRNVLMLNAIIFKTDISMTYVYGTNKNSEGKVILIDK